MLKFQNKKLTTFAYIFIALCCTILITACGAKEDMSETEIALEENSEENSEVGSPLVIESNEDATQETDDAITYDFLDVYGESYTAVLLEDIPMHTYDYSRLNIESDLYTYENKSGDITSSVGIDVSKYQGDIDWEQIRDYGIEFAIIRLGYRGYSEEGKLMVDEYYEANIQGALDAGLQVGVYFFSQAITEEEALEEAEFVLEHIEGYDITMPVVFDTEIIEDETARTFDVEGQVFTDACIVFCDRIDEAGYDSMIYFNLVWSAFTLDLEQLVDYDKWYADYYDEPQYPYAFSMWQYTESAIVPGVDGNVDLNLYFE